MNPYRLRVIQKMGGQCECCGEAEPDFLVVKKPVGADKSVWGTSYYYQIMRDGVPPSDSLVCLNCAGPTRQRKSWVCPHARRFGK